MTRRDQNANLWGIKSAPFVENKIRRRQLRWSRQDPVTIFVGAKIIFVLELGVQAAVVPRGHGVGGREGDRPRGERKSSVIGIDPSTE